MAINMVLEICTGSLEDCIIAEKGGADRVELNSSLILGGLTPSAGTIKRVKEEISIPVIVMIRPRQSGFVYNNYELSVMERDIKIAIDAGADGIAFGVLGVLKENGEIDLNVCKRFLTLIDGKEAVFHRAFDLTPDPKEALEKCIDLGITRVLTSGQKSSAIEGADCINKLVRHAQGRIEILPAGGINLSTVKDVIAKTGCTQVHGSLMSDALDRSAMLRRDIKFTNSKEQPEHIYKKTDIEKVARMRSVLDELSK